MLVGLTGSGKSVCWRVLQSAMTRLKRDGESSYQIVRVSKRLLIVDNFLILCARNYLSAILRSTQLACIY